MPPRSPKKACRARVFILIFLSMPSAREGCAVVQYVVSYGDDRKAKRAEAEAEFNRRNPYWASRPEKDEEIRLIEISVVEAVDGRPKHPEWLAYLEALREPDRPENALAIAAYEAASRPTLRQETA